jgi:hypothetical protein
VVGVLGFGESSREELDCVGEGTLAVGLIPGFLARCHLLGEHTKWCENKEREGNGGETEGDSRHIHTVPVSVPIGKIRRFSSAQGAIDI